MHRKIRISDVLIYLVAWLVFNLFVTDLLFDPHASFTLQFIATLVITGLTLFPSRYASRIFIPRFLYKKRIGRFIGAVLFLAFLNTLLTSLVAGGLYYALSGNSIFISLFYFQFIFLYIYIVNFMVITVVCAIRIILDRFGMETHLHEVETEKTGTELAFLRAQMNPHFLFNVLNTIYFQIRKENAEARGSVEKLSEMLRYQLYECNTDLIDISREIAYIENYVAFQQLRMEMGTDLQLNLPPVINECKIAPLLIQPLVENAFKYLSNFREPGENRLHIDIYQDESMQLVVHVMNTFQNNGNERPRNASGLGLQNLKRRLTLLYPGRHSMTQKRNGNIYETTLTINI